jgi:hypothetical protein
MLLACTSSHSHREEISQIGRYVKSDNGIVFIEESFVDSIEAKEKAGSGFNWRKNK